MPCLCITKCSMQLRGHADIWPGIGTGKKLIDNGTIPAAFTFMESLAMPSGVIIANDNLAEEIKTGTMGS